MFDDPDQVEADHVIKRLTELAPSALLGEQHFFMGWGLHRFGFDSLQKIDFLFILTQASLAIPLPREVWRLLPRKTRQP